MPSWVQALLLVVVVAVSSQAVFGGAGIAVFILVLVVAAILYRVRNPVSLPLILLLLGAIVLFLLLLPAVQTAREASSRPTCMNNLHQIGLAVLQYESEYHCFPPPYIADKNGKPMHSWRVLILPYLERKDLYERYDFKEPWDAPNNRKLLALRPRVFACPGDESARKDGATTTSYVAVVGKNALWQPGKPLASPDLAPRGGASNTVMLIEVANAGINWTEPKDLCLDEPNAEGASFSDMRRSIGHLSSGGFLIRSTGSFGANVSFADASVRFVLGAAFSSEKLKDWLTIGGFRETEIDALPGIGMDDLPQHRHWRVNWTNCFALAVWIVSVLLLFVRAWCSRKAAVQEAAQTGDEATPHGPRMSEDHHESRE